MDKPKTDKLESTRNVYRATLQVTERRLKDTKDKVATMQLGIANMEASIVADKAKLEALK